MVIINQALMFNKRAFISKIILATALAIVLAIGSPEHSKAEGRLPVGSPIELQFTYPCQDLASIQVVLDDEVKDIIARQILPVDCENKDTGLFEGKLYWDPFERLTPAHLSLGAYDAQTRLIWVHSIDIQFVEADTPTRLQLLLDNPIKIDRPVQNETIRSDSFLLEGSLRVNNLNPLNVELVSDAGRIIGSGVFQLPRDALGKTIRYELPITITNRSPGKARLSVMQFGQDIFGIESIQSVYLSIE